MCTTPTKSIADNHQLSPRPLILVHRLKGIFLINQRTMTLKVPPLHAIKKILKRIKLIRNEVNEDHYSCNTTRKSYTISTLKHASSVKPMFASPFQAYASSNDKNSPEKSNSNVRTPEKPLSTPSTTPYVRATKKCAFEISFDTPKKDMDMEKRSVRAKLFGSPQKCTETNELDDSENISISVSEDDDDDVVSILPSNILQQIKDKERQREEERVRVSFKAMKRKEMVTSIPKLIDMIHIIFQSGNQSSISKNELINKLTAGYHSTFDRSEVEQQLGLLQEFVPGWISLKMVSGDSRYSLDKS